MAGKANHAATVGGRSTDFFVIVQDAKTTNVLKVPVPHRAWRIDFGLRAGARIW